MKKPRSPTADLFEERTFYFSKRLRHLFKYGGLPRKWCHQYPPLFDDHDLSLTRRGSSHLFFEWLASITLYHSDGYRSLHKFNCENHPDKFATLRRLAGPEFAELLSKCTGCPDLLVVSPDSSDWYFCEIKGPRDRISPRQRSIARLVRKHTGRRVVLLHFEAIA